MSRFMHVLFARDNLTLLEATEVQESHMQLSGHAAHFVVSAVLRIGTHIHCFQSEPLWCSHQGLPNLTLNLAKPKAVSSL